MRPQAAIDGGDAMLGQHTVLLLGGTGRTGRLVLEELLRRGVAVRAIVRSAARLPEDVAGAPGLSVVEADLVSMTDGELLGRLRGCDAVVSCLGHTASLRGVFGRPRNLVAAAVARVCRGAEALQPSEPIRLVLMSSVSVNHGGACETRRGALEKAMLWILRGVLPPSKDNQKAADVLWESLGTAARYVHWVAVRPDTLTEGDVGEYTLHEGLVSSLFAPDRTTRANVAHFMCELVAEGAVWERWQGGFPVIVNANASDGGSDGGAR